MILGVFGQRVNDCENVALPEIAKVGIGPYDHQSFL
jgi:hypothetical protein